jgi:hypothetical protein
MSYAACQRYKMQQLLSLEKFGDMLKIKKLLLPLTNQSCVVDALLFRNVWRKKKKSVSLEPKARFQHLGIFAPPFVQWSSISLLAASTFFGENGWTNPYTIFFVFFEFYCYCILRLFSDFFT